MNVAYKHLDAKLRVADLTVGQWVSITGGVVIGLVWALYVSPLGTYATLISAIYIGAIPAGAALLASMSEFDLWLVLRSALRWRRLQGRFVSGAGQSAEGYVVLPDADADVDAAGQSPEQRRVRELEPASLWEDT